MSNLQTWYREQTTSNLLKFDQSQAALINELDQFLDNFARLNFITRWWKKEDKLGYYIYGDVGRGKSMIMNAMYQLTITPRKIRFHFHEFMQQIHQQLAERLEQQDPLTIIAKNLKKQYDIIYLDEMHISDIATAMIIKKVLENLFAQKIYIITSSNYHPDKLWPNGLMRERFLPAIELIKERLNITSLNSQSDYRLINSSINQLFILQNPESKAKLNHIFESINLNHRIEINTTIEINSRKIPVIKYGSDIIWFDFAVICGAMRSQLDYMALIKQFHWFSISDVFMLTLDKKDIARRFTWLIDILYDSNSKLALSSTVAVNEIYLEGDFSFEFSRTVSRLEEMQTKEYLQKSKH